MTCRNAKDDVKTGGSASFRDQFGGCPEDCPSDIRHVGGAKPDQALVGNVRTCRPDAKGDVQAAQTARIRVPMRGTGAEQLVGGRKVLSWNWTKGAAVFRRDPEPTGSGRSSVAKVKPFSIPKRDVWDAFQKVKANQGAAGVDGQTIAEFEADLANNLYRLWNRMSSGSYFPPPVRRVDLPKSDGRTRPLGIPTVGDRGAQEVVKQYLGYVADRIPSMGYGKPDQSYPGASCRGSGRRVIKPRRGCLSASREHRRTQLRRRVYIILPWTRSRPYSSRLSFRPERVLSGALNQEWDNTSR